MDEFGAELDRNIGEVAIGPDSSADAIARFEDRRFNAGSLQMISGGQPGDSRADDQNLHRRASGFILRILPDD